MSIETSQHVIKQWVIKGNTISCWMIDFFIKSTFHLEMVINWSSKYVSCTTIILGLVQKYNNPSFYLRIYSLFNISLNAQSSILSIIYIPLIAMTLTFSSRNYTSFTTIYTIWNKRILNLQIFKRWYITLMFLRYNRRQVILVFIFSELSKKDYVVHN